MDIHDGMPRSLLTLLRLGEKAPDVMSIGRREVVLDAPHLLEHHVSGRLCNAPKLFRGEGAASFLRILVVIESGNPVRIEPGYHSIRFGRV